ncbi:unnamed protein product, partial [Closterium sp. NIES-54]
GPPIVPHVPARSALALSDPARIVSRCPAATRTALQRLALPAPTCRALLQPARRALLLRTSRPVAARTLCPAALRVAPCCSQCVTPYCSQRVTLCCHACRALLQPARPALLPCSSRPAAASASRPTAANASRSAALRVAPCCSQRVAPYYTQHSRPAATTAAAAAARATAAAGGGTAGSAADTGGVGGATGSAGGAAGAGGAGPTTDRHCLSWPISRQLRRSLPLPDNPTPQQLREWVLQRGRPDGGGFVFFTYCTEAAAESAGDLLPSAAALGASESAAALGASDRTSLYCPPVSSSPLRFSVKSPPPHVLDELGEQLCHSGCLCTFIPGGQRVAIYTCSRTGCHLATFTRQPGSSLYTLTTASAQGAEAGQVAASSQVSASGQLAASCSCRVLSHQTLLWHHSLGQPSLPRLRGMHSRLLISGLPSSLPSLPRSPAPPCLPCVEGRQRAAPHSSNFPPTTAHLHTLSQRPRPHSAHLWPRVSEPETSPTLRWTGKVGDASVFWVWGALSLVRNAKASKLSSRTLFYVFLGFPTDAPPWQFYSPRSR